MSASFRRGALAPLLLCGFVGAARAQGVADPKAATPTQKVDLSTVTAPTPAVALATGTSEYAGSIQGPGPKLVFTSTLTIAPDDDGSLRVSEVAKMELGEISDVTRLDAKTLIVKSRSVKQGPVAIDLTFAGNRATGTVNMGAEGRPVDVQLDGPLFADGGGAHAVLGTLPLADGYSTLFRNFDVQKQKPAIKKLTVSAVEPVTVPAGTFNAWKIEIVSAEGEPGTTTVWIAKDSRKLVKVSATLPRSGATLTTELRK